LDKPRKYFYVLENGYEKNDAFYAGCCMSMDSIYKTYFDRGIYDMQSCSHRMGCVRGAAQIHPGNGKTLKSLPFVVHIAKIISSFSLLFFSPICLLLRRLPSWS
jgi:hypothetical protein